MNVFGWMLVALQVSQGGVYAYNSKYDHALLWVLYAAANVVLMRMAR